MPDKAELRVAHWICRNCKTQLVGVTSRAPTCTRCQSELEPVTRNEEQTRQLAEKLHMDAHRCGCGMYFLRRLDQHDLNDCPSCWMDARK